MMSSWDEKGCSTSSSSSSSLRRPSEFMIQPPNSSIYDFGYPPVPQNQCASPVSYNMVSKAGSFSYSRYGNDPDPADHYHNISSNNSSTAAWDVYQGRETRPCMIRWKSGKKVDQRLLMLLESFFQEIYVKREDFFKKIFPGMYEEFTDVFNKIGALLWNNNDETRHRTLQRSLSVGSPRRRPERFKVRTPNVVIASDSGGQGGGSQTTAPK